MPHYYVHTYIYIYIAYISAYIYSACLHYAYIYLCTYLSPYASKYRMDMLSELFPLSYTRYPILVFFFCLLEFVILIFELCICIRI